MPTAPLLGTAKVDDVNTPVGNEATLFTEPLDVERATGLRGIFLELLKILNKSLLSLIII